MLRETSSRTRTGTSAGGHHDAEPVYDHDDVETDEDEGQQAPLEGSSATSSSAVKHRYHAGSFGFVQSPATSCQSLDAEQENKRVTKVFTGARTSKSWADTAEADAAAEWAAAQLAHGIDPEGVFLVPALDRCHLTGRMLPQKARHVYAERTLHNKELGDDTRVPAIEYENGGVDLTDFFYGKGLDLYAADNDLNRLQATVHVLFAARNAFRAVLAIRSHGYQHCDIKTENTVIDTDGSRLRWRLVDFGFMRFADYVTEALATRGAVAADSAHFADYGTLAAKDVPGGGGGYRVPGGGGGGGEGEEEEEGTDDTIAAMPLWVQRSPTSHSHYSAHSRSGGTGPVAFVADARRRGASALSSAVAPTTPLSSATGLTTRPGTSTSIDSSRVTSPSGFGTAPSRASPELLRPSVSELHKWVSATKQVSYGPADASLALLYLRMRSGSVHASNLATALALANVHSMKAPPLAVEECVSSLRLIVNGTGQNLPMHMQRADVVARLLPEMLECLATAEGAGDLVTPMDTVDVFMLGSMVQRVLAWCLLDWSVPQHADLKAGAAAAQSLRALPTWQPLWALLDNMTSYNPYARPSAADALRAYEGALTALRRKYLPKQAPRGATKPSSAFR